MAVIIDELTADVAPDEPHDAKAEQRATTPPSPTAQEAAVREAIRRMQRRAMRLKAD